MQVLTLSKTRSGDQVWSRLAGFVALGTLCDSVTLWGYPKINLPSMGLQREKSYAKAKDSQRNQEAVPPVRQGQGEAPSLGDQPLGVAHEPQAEAQPPRHDRDDRHQLEDDRRSIGWQQLLAVG